MALAHETTLFDVDDCKVYALLTDVAGASPTYSAGIDVPGISAVSVDPNIVSAELKGDARVIATKGRTDRLSFKCTYGKLSGDVMAVIMGAGSQDTGTTPNQKSSFYLASPATLPYFKVEFLISDVDTGLGDLHVVLYKCKLTGGTLLGTSSDSFGQPTFDADCIAPAGNITPAGGSPVTGVMGQWILAETASSLSA